MARILAQITAIGLLIAALVVVISRTEEMITASSRAHHAICDAFPGLLPKQKKMKKLITEYGTFSYQLSKRADDLGGDAVISTPILVSEVIGTVKNISSNYTNARFLDNEIPNIEYPEIHPAGKLHQGTMNKPARDDSFKPFGWRIERRVSGEKGYKANLIITVTGRIAWDVPIEVVSEDNHWLSCPQ